MILTGGDGYSIEFSTPDCQHGWSVVKNGTGQSIGCYKTQEEAEQAMKGLDGGSTDIQAEMKKSNDGSSFWGGAFAPVYRGIYDVDSNSQNQDDAYYYPSQSPRDTDGEDKVGYGVSR